jgi:hypothetical protein
VNYFSDFQECPDRAGSLESPGTAASRPGVELVAHMMGGRIATVDIDGRELAEVAFCEPKPYS